MPSFRCKIKKLRFQGILTEKETERILDALDKAEKFDSSDLISRSEAIKHITAEYNRRLPVDGLKLAYIEKALNEVEGVTK